MKTIDKIRNIQRRILTAASETVVYQTNWGQEYALKNITSACSPEDSFSFPVIETMTLDDLRTCSREELYSVWFGNWEDDLLLIPLYLVPFIYKFEKVHSISGQESMLMNCDSDARFGCIAYGFYLEEGQQNAN
jgi:hypothetical protein